MAVARPEGGGSAMMIIVPSQPVPVDVLEQVRSAAGVLSAVALIG
jgi:hypothetical protein